MTNDDIPDGKLSDKDRKIFSEWIDNKTKNLIGKCPICQSRQWRLMDHFIHIPIFRKGVNYFGSGPAYPNVGILCTNCGNVQLINAVVAGLVEPEGGEK